MSLKQELKAWEASFRSTHGRAPTKEDIKQHPDIAAKYKQYNKAKVQQANGGASSSKATTAAPKPSTSSANPPPPPVFKTPTKPRPSRSQPRPAAAVAEASTSSDAPTHPSPSKRTSTSTSSSSQQPTFVLANSPSKLRALAALHSSSGSPNKRASLSSADVPAVGLSGIKEVFSAGAGLSPQKKAKNPFASPRKPGDAEKGMFGEFEKQERARMREKKKLLKEKRGVLGKAATSQGAGWGAAGGFANGGERVFSRTSSVASAANGMDLDEVDSFFGGSSQPSQPSQGRTAAGADTVMAEDDGEDDFLGPSPVKPSTSSSSNLASFFGLSQPVPPPPSFSPSSSSSQKKEKKDKHFKPLIPPCPPPASSTQPQKPKLFSTSLRGSSFSTTAFNTASSTSILPLSRGLKRAPSSAILKSSTSTLRAGDEDDALLDDADDSFYADALEAVEAEMAGKGKGGKGKGKGPAAKRKKVVAPRKGKGKAPAGGGEEGEREEVDDGVTVLARDGKKGEMVLQFEEAAADGEEEEEMGGRRRERVVVHALGMGGKVGAAQKEERGEREEGDGMDEDEEGEAALREAEGGEEEGNDELELVDSVSLLRPRPRTYLFPAATRRSAPSTSHPDAREESEIDTSSLPADLASVLSLRASPQKKSRGAGGFLSEAKERQVARVLGEPLAGARGRGRRKGGLLDLADDEDEEGEGVGEGAEGGVGEEEGEDDDWDEEVDGWKETGEAMDGYYSGGDEERW